MNLYRGMQNTHSFNSLAKSVYVPDAHLGVGNGETLTAQAMKVEYQQKQNYVVIPQTVSMSQIIQPVGHATPISEENLSQDFFLGDPLGGF